MYEVWTPCSVLLYLEARFPPCQCGKVGASAHPPGVLHTWLALDGGVLHTQLALGGVSHTQLAFDGVLHTRLALGGVLYTRLALDGVLYTRLALDGVYCSSSHTLPSSLLPVALGRMCCETQQMDHLLIKTILSSLQIDVEQQ